MVASVEYRPKDVRLTQRRSGCASCTRLLDAMEMCYLQTSACAAPHYSYCTVHARPLGMVAATDFKLAGTHYAEHISGLATTENFHAALASGGLE